VKTATLILLGLILVGALVAIGAAFGLRWGESHGGKDFLNGVFTGFFAGFGLMSAVIVTNWLVGAADRAIGGGVKAAPEKP
jgi:hypothetical protein